MIMFLTYFHTDVNNRLNIKQVGDNMKKIIQLIIRIAGVICFIIAFALTMIWAFSYWNIALIFINFKEAAISAVKPLLFTLLSVILCTISENFLNK